MERQLLLELYALVRDLARTLPRTPKVQIPDWLIVLTLLWAACWDRPICWACKRENWPAELAYLEPPSPSTMTRRLSTLSVWSILAMLLAHYQASLGPSDEHRIDAKALTVGFASKDPDARLGKVDKRHFARGYKWHAIVNAQMKLEAWGIWPMNVHEVKAAHELLKAPLEGSGYLVGDSQYEVNSAYDDAAQIGLQLVASPRRNSNAMGHRRQSPYRRLGLQLARSKDGKMLLHRRYCIDRFFGWCGNSGGGLEPLPNFVRRIQRVRIWVHAKLVLITQRRHRLSALTR